jgi:hypothetical protein
VVIIGDYSDDLPPFLTAAEKTELGEAKMSLYFFAKQLYQELEKEDVILYQGADALSFRTDNHHVLANLDTNEYLDPAAFGHSPPVLTAFLDEEGGVLRVSFSCLFYSTGERGGRHRKAETRALGGKQGGDQE